MSVCPTFDYCEFCDASYPAEDGNCLRCPKCEICGCTVDPEADDTWGIFCEEHTPDPSNPAGDYWIGIMGE